MLSCSPHVPIITRYPIAITKPKGVHPTQSHDTPALFVPTSAAIYLDPLTEERAALDKKIKITITLDAKGSTLEHVFLTDLKIE